MKTLIKNGIIVDGTAAPAYRGELIINNGVIAEILPQNSTQNEQNFDSVIDAENSFVAPGFIDVHSHSDIMSLVDNGLKPKIMQGITSEVIGQCGFSFAPMPKEKQEQWKKELIVEDFSVPWEWESLEEYFTVLKAHGLESNLIPFVGHGALRFNINGSSSNKLTSPQLIQLQQLINESFTAGVFGVSLGLIYRPSMFADRKELEIVAKTAADNKGIMAVHLRSESDALLEAIKEMIDLSQQYGAKVHISHLKAIGKRNWWKIDKALELLEKNKISFDHYPYTSGSTSLLAILPPHVLAAPSIDDVCRNLQKDEVKQELKYLFYDKIKSPDKNSWDNLPSLVGWENIFIVSVKSSKNKNIVGLNLREIGEKMNIDPVEAAINLIIEEKGQIKMVDYYANEQSVLKKLRHSSGMIGTDALMGNGIHPRVYGTYPKIIGEYVFKQKQISLENAISAMTYRPANLLGIKDRGVIKTGNKADLVIFTNKFSGTATFKSPSSFPVGLRYVIINGKIKVNDGKYLENNPGTLILRNKQ